MGRLVDMLWQQATREDQWATTMDDAEDVVRWTDCAYHRKFTDWLQKQADAPIDLRSQHAELIAATARANTMKEVRQHLAQLEERANLALERERG